MTRLTNRLSWAVAALLSVGVAWQAAKADPEHCRFSTGAQVVWDRQWQSEEQCVLVSPHGACPIGTQADGTVRVFVHCLKFGDDFEG